mgnify:CR=1 FL=1
MNANNWNSAVTVRLSDDNKGYYVHGDERIPSDVLLPRVTGILNIIEKQGLRTWAMNMALDYLREHINTTDTGSPAEAVRNALSPEALNELLENASHAHEQKRDTAADYGVDAHALLQQLYIDPETAVPDEFRPVVDAWEEWIDNAGLKIIGTELSMYYYNDALSFAGTADLLAVNSDGIPVICDYKTGANVYPEYALQMAAYSLALSYCNSRGHSTDKLFTDEQIENTRAFIIKLPKEEGKLPDIKEVNNLAKQRQAFTYACMLRQWQSGRDKWVKKSRKKIII